ncbi:hypothetical protein Tcan_01848 [Toxocara canis]|uniref:Uncharacterized protein n=1 Tax=Toxocara canis TaxID=6265 RepID=A0A0B2VTJ1_TOXCA|nr:hypothetical protein Tcan_01848 [Toxocara canis]
MYDRSVGQETYRECYCMGNEWETGNVGLLYLDTYKLIFRGSVRTFDESFSERSQPSQQYRQERI